MICNWPPFPAHNRYVRTWSGRELMAKRSKDQRDQSDQGNACQRQDSIEKILKRTAGLIDGIFRILFDIINLIPQAASRCTSRENPEATGIAVVIVVLIAGMLFL
jgi:hypothetical protein